VSPILPAFTRPSQATASWIENSCTYACRLDQTGLVLEVGHALAALLGIDLRAGIPQGMDFATLVALPEEREGVSAIFRPGKLVAARDIIELTLSPAGGLPQQRVRWLLAPMGTNQGEPGFIVKGWKEDVWPMMQRQILRFARVVELTSEAVAMISPKGVIEYVNPAFTSVTGYNAYEIIGTSVSTIVSVPEDISMVQEALACFRRDEVWDGSLRLRRKDGSAMFLCVRIQPVVDAPGQERRFLVVGTDMSMQRNLERQVQELQRLESMGTLANGLAHRFNNILAAISGQTELLIMSCADEGIKKRAEKVLDSALKGKEVVEQIGLFGRRNEPRSRLADIVPVVRNAVRFIRAAQPRCIQIEENIPEEGRSVMVNTGEIHQVMLNLLTNALEAVGDRQGTIRVSVNEGMFQLTPQGEPLRCMELVVQDDGPGIDPGIRHRIFEPFFTTRGLANSSGMGLATAHGIVQRHGGSIICESELGKGATFRVLLPVYAPKPRMDAIGDEDLCKGRILLVDKQGFALESGKRVLESLNYEVMAVDLMEDAEKLLADKREAFDLLITSLHMDGGDGVALSRASRRVRPDMPILLCANMREKFDEESAMDSGASSILRRPASREQLSDIVDKLMDCGK